MNDHADRPTGMESADTSSNFDHPEWNRSSALARATFALKEALDALRYSNRQEVEAARCIIEQALEQIEAGEAGEG